MSTDRIVCVVSGKPYTLRKRQHPCNLYWTGHVVSAMEVRLANLQGALFEMEDYYVRKLHFDDGRGLQSLCKRSTDYLELVPSLRPDLSEANYLFTRLPEGKNTDDKLLLGVFELTAGLIGVIDVIRDYPVTWEWYLALLMLAPDYRGQGLGRRTYLAFEKWAERAGAHHIQLDIAEQNERACRFWQSLGFEAIDRRPSEAFGVRENVMIRMRRSLPAWRPVVGLSDW
jgi:ribosomal protein S18 acetylase RimI-like enzyme